MTTLKSLRVLTLAASLAGAAVGVSAQPVTLSSIGIAHLKAIYLRCADESARSPLDSIDFAFCAGVGDALRDRAFAGDFERLIAWWHGARTPVAAATESAPGDASGSRAASVSLPTMFATE